MHIITELYQINSCQSVLQENFSSNKRKWEITDIPSEKSEIKDGYYFMHNKSETRWNYYKTKTSLKQDQDFVLEALIEIENKEDSWGHFGLVWGFDEDHQFLNRFTLSADGKRALIMHYEKDHKRVFHRFQNRKFSAFNIKKPFRLSIIKMGAYFHFLINEVTVYMSHESAFASEGNYIGYYIEPGLSIKSNYIEVKKIKARPMHVTSGFNQLMTKG